MYIEKTPEIISIEQSLINFLCMKRDIERFVTGGIRRIKGLNLGIDVQDKGTCFTVSIGMCQAWFNIETGLKERGNCFGIDQYIREWYKAASVKDSIRGIIINKVKH